MLYSNFKYNQKVLKEYGNNYYFLDNVVKFII